MKVLFMLLSGDNRVFHKIIRIETELRGNRC